MQNKKKKNTFKAAESNAVNSTFRSEPVGVSPAPKVATTCPQCGATTLPDDDGRCEYCGGAARNIEPPVIKSTAKKKKRNKLSSILTSVLIVIALGVFVFSLLQILTIMGEYKEGRDEYSKISQGSVIVSESGYLVIDYDNLLGINSDFKGWIDIPGTDVSYPIVYSAQDNDVYLRTTFEKKSNSSGSIFIDYRCDPTYVEPVTVIYGHHMKDGSMFNNVKLFMDKSYWEEHKEVHIYTKNGIMIYDIFSAYTPHIDDECFAFEPANTSPEAFSSWINNAKSKSHYNTGITPTIDDRVILLSTCVSGGEETEDYRHVVAAVYRETVNNPTA